MTAHSKVGFSARKRWRNCSGSVKLVEIAGGSKSSAHAQEGTAAHALQERCLRADEDAADWIGLEFEYDDHGEKKKIVVSEEMGGYIQGVLDNIRADLASDPEAVLLVETKLHLTQVHQDLFSTGDVAIWFPGKRRLQCRDLKYGKGISVDVEDEDGNANDQLEGYGLGYLLANPQWKPVDVELVVDQPRAFHVDGPTRRTVLPVSHFVDLAADLADEVHETELAAAAYGKLPADEWAAAFLQPGEHCRSSFCAAQGICPAIRGKAQELAKQAFAPGLPYDAQQLADTLEWLPILEAWIKNTREFAYAEAEKGHDIPRHKLVEKRATRKWRSESEAAAVIVPIIGADAAFEHKLMTPAAMEKCLPKDQRKILDDLCIKESSGHTLVHESDRREAIKVDAKSAFANQ